MRRPMHDMLCRARGRMSLHMPGCQGRAPFDSWNAYQLETTETSETDNLYQPLGAIAQAQELAARSANAGSALLLHNGSTAGIQAMLLYACKRGDAVVLPRNAHLSCLNLCAMAGIKPIFAEPSYTSNGRVYTTSTAFANALDAHPEATAALALHVDYYGLVSDLPGVAKAVHQRNRLLLCDEAHGATFNWRDDEPNAMQCGADMAVQSAHKTLPALTSGAWLHAAESIDVQRLCSTLRMVQTSSPSFVNLLSLDDARAWMDGYGAQACRRLAAALDSFRSRADKLGFANGQDDAPPGLHYDALRLVLRAKHGGQELQRELEKRRIDVEMSDDRHVVCILSLMDGARRLKRLERALRSIAAQSYTKGEAWNAALATEAAERNVTLTLTEWPQSVLPMSEAAFAESEPVPLHQAAGRISAVAAGPYPPGTAWLTPGDEIPARVAAQLERLPVERTFGVTDDHCLLCLRAKREKKE